MNEMNKSNTNEQVILPGLWFTRGKPAVRSLSSAFRQLRGCVSSRSWLSYPKRRNYQSVVLAILIGCAVASAQDWPLNKNLPIDITTSVSGGTFTNADSAPTWILTKNDTTVVTTGTYTVLGTGTLAAHYYGTASLNSSTFSAGDRYVLEATGTISSVPVKTIVAMGFAQPAEIIAGERVVYAGGGTINNATGISGGSINVTGIIDAGTLSIAGASTFTGQTNLGAVRVAVSSGDAIAVTVAGANGYALNLAGAGSLGGGLTMNSLNDSGSLNIAGVSNFAGIVNTGSISTSSLVSGAATFNSLTVTNLFNAGSFSTGTAAFGTLSLTNASNLSLLSIGTLNSYTTPPTAAQNATAVWRDLSASSDFTLNGSIGSLMVNSSSGGGFTSTDRTLLQNIGKHEGIR